MLCNIILEFFCLCLNRFIRWVHFFHLSELNKYFHKFICDGSFVIFCPVLCFFFILFVLCCVTPLLFCELRVLIDFLGIKCFEIHIVYSHYFYSSSEKNEIFEMLLFHRKQFNLLLQRFALIKIGRIEDAFDFF